MNGKVGIGIIICDRYRRCAGGKCLKALRNREGAFSRYQGMEVELAGYTTCDGCPGGNIEYAGEEMVVVGTHPIPENYLTMHSRLGTWQEPVWPDLLAPSMADEATRKAYN